jgi:hypothetical protein
VTYVLRVYRHEATAVRGILEDPRTGARRAFTAPGELWALILPGDAREAKAIDGAPPNSQPKETKP